MARYDDLIEQSEEILETDDEVAAEAPHKLSPWLRAQLVANLGTTTGRDVARDLAEGRRRAASSEVQSAYGRGRDLIRRINRWVNALNENLDEEVNIAALRSSYGLGRVIEQDMTKGFVRDTLMRLKAASPQIEPPAARLRTKFLDEIDAVLAIVSQQGSVAAIGTRATLSDDKRAAQAGLEETVSRVRYHLWSTLPRLMFDPLLHDYGFTPRQEHEAGEPIVPAV